MGKGWAKSLNPTTSSYAGVISRESIQISLAYTTMMKLDVQAANAQHVYPQAPSSEKDYIIYGTEFGVETLERVALITRALYGRNFSWS